jgi:hypothetical protein
MELFPDVLVGRTTFCNGTARVQGQEARVSVIVHWPSSGVSRAFGGPSHAVSTRLFFPDVECFIKEACSSLSLGK